MEAPIPIVKPCTADWNHMAGDDRKRICAHCDKHVHNLSALTPRELAKFVENRDGTECIGYVYREDGSIETASRWSRFFRRMHRVRVGVLWVLAAVLPSLFSGCAKKSPTLGGPRRPLPGEAPPLRQNVQYVPEGKVTAGVVAPSLESKPKTNVSGIGRGRSD